MRHLVLGIASLLGSTTIVHAQPALDRPTTDDTRGAAMYLEPGIEVGATRVGLSPQSEPIIQTPGLLSRRRQ